MNQRDRTVLSAAVCSPAGRRRPAAAEVFRALTGRVQPKGKAKAKEVVTDLRAVGRQEGCHPCGKGGAVTVELPVGLSQQRWPAFEEALRKLLSSSRRHLSQAPWCGTTETWEPWFVRLPYPLARLFSPAEGRPWYRTARIRFTC